ncbi:hypothetical protein TNIN_338321 [Trichonephila inaurata madagascariensis]|uniref:Uncharacterized protein n=1 Tax=Trichonephila inaurata madagascariensis TaxID=2747483 RepID=A0A8X6WSL5_9ARAC|nr:hypothetical protein TNIN_338321 [Trichonephila inaurata madagascariensis]
MDVLKSLNGWSKRLYGDHVMPLDFASLAWNAASCPFSNVLQHGRPDEAVWMRRFVARIPGWERLWRERNTSKRSSSGP